MSAMQIGEKYLIDQDGTKKKAEVVDTNGDMVEFKIEGEDGTVFMDIVPTDIKGEFTLKPRSHIVRHTVV